MHTNPNTSTRPIRQLAVFYGVAMAGTTALALAFPNGEGPAALLSILAPALGVLVAVRLTVTKGSRAQVWKDMGWRPRFRWWPVAAALPVICVAPAYLVAAAAGLVRLPDLPAGLVDGVFTIVVFALVLLGEEVGWRGFMLPRMRQLTGKDRGAFLTGLAQGLFHVPLLVLTVGYDQEGARWVVVPTVVALITVAGMAFAWIKDRSGSLIPVAVMHAGVNASFDLFALAAVASSASLPYVAGESGLLTLAATTAVAVVLTRHGRTRVAAEPATANPSTPVSPVLEAV